MRRVKRRRVSSREAARQIYNQVFAPRPPPPPKDALYLGRHSETKERVYIDPDELRFGLHMIGAPGQGKSNALKDVGSQLIELNKETGHGVAMLDPHGDVAEHLLDFCIEGDVDPAKVLYFDLKEGPFVPILNPLRRHGDLVRIAYGLVEAITRAFGLEFMMENPLTAEAMVNTAIVLLEKGYSLAETTYFMHHTPEHKQIREHLIEGSSAVDYWRGIAELPKREQRMETASAARRFDYFLRFPSLRCMLGQTEAGIDVGRIMDEGGIAIFNLGLHGTEITPQAQRFIGALILDQFKNATMRRRKHRAKPFHLLIDEFSHFTSYDTMETLAEARGFGLRLVLAHQRMDQLMMKDQDPRLMKAVLAIPNKLIFGAGLVDEQLTIARQAYAPWVDRQKRKLELYHRGFKPILKKIELHSQAVAESEAAFDATASSHGVVTPPGADSTIIDGDAASSGAVRGRNVIDGVSDAYITEHEEYKELTSVQFDSQDDQIFDRMQENIRRGIGSSLFMHGYQEPPQPITMPEQKDLEDVDREPYLKRLYEGQTQNFKPRERGIQAIADRKAELLRAALEQAPEIETSKGPVFKPIRKREKAR